MPTRVAAKQLPPGYPVKLGVPPGLSLSSDGILSGIPKETGIWMFEVQVTDANGNKAYRVITFTVHSGSIK